MNAPTCELFASINGSEVGVIREEGGLWSFEYSHRWIRDAHSFDLSPDLRRDAGKITDGGTKRPVQWFFDNLLPEDAARVVGSRGSDRVGRRLRLCPYFERGSPFKASLGLPA